MKTKLRFLFAAFIGACTFASLQTVQAASVASSTDSSAPALSRAEALRLITAAKKYEAHPAKGPDGTVSKPNIIMPDFDIAVPPPAPRSETKPEAPAPGMVWVAGHYMPVKGEWRWVNGEWAVPALPISVWIPAKYDEERKHWDPGYWQPDIPSSDPVPEPASKDGKPIAKPAAGY